MDDTAVIQGSDVTTQQAPRPARAIQKRSSTLAPPRAVVTEDAASYGVLATVRALHAGGYEPWVAINGTRSYARYSRACAGTVTVPDPAIDARRYRQRLAAAAAALGATIVLPGTDVGLLALAGKERLFGPEIVLGTCSAETAWRATNKWELARVGEQVGLQAPPSRIVAAEDLTRISRRLAYPAVIKPLRPAIPTADGRPIRFGARRIASRDELRAAIGSAPHRRWIVQQFIRGQLAAVCGVAWQGQIVCAAHQVASRIYPPDCGISAYARTVAPDPELERQIGRLIATLDCHGIFQAQVLETAGERYLIDLNLRPFGSLALTIAAGLNLPVIWADLLLGRAGAAGAKRLAWRLGGAPPGYRVGVRYRSEERDAGALLAAVLRRDFSTALGGLVPRRRTVHAVFSLRDPLPLIASVGALRRVPRLMLSGHRA